ncbi:MAG: hypothetical protein HZA51_13185 [Planctomycetes bacterium]|nr:hypothetical protein [Planctomycetota bacterium]
MSTTRHVNLRELTDRIRAIEQRCEISDGCDEPAADRIATGWTDIDAALGGGLAAGGLHEWFGVEDTARGETHPADARWTPPLCILAHLAWQAFDRSSSSPWVVWVGRACHPYPRVLVRGADRRMLERSLFVSPRDVAGRVWAMDLALRSQAVGFVVADGSGLDRSATQRIQLLARAQAKVVLAVCPPRQRSILSAAQTRWLVRTAHAPGQRRPGEIHPGWSVELLRCKGMRPTQDHPSWYLEWNRAEGVVHCPARLADLAGSPQQREVRTESRRRRSASA